MTPSHRSPARRTDRRTAPRTARKTEKTPREPPALSELLPQLHVACVQAGAGATLRGARDGLSLLRPWLPAKWEAQAGQWDASAIQQRLVRSVFARHALKPARWEIEGILAIAGPQGDWLPDTTSGTLRTLLQAWLPSALSARLPARVPMESLLGDTVRAVAGTWAIGRYAEAVCRLRLQGGTWLPEPSLGLLRLTPTRLRQWSAEALRMALPLRLAGGLIERSLRMGR